jgi:hypothetical protein
MEQIIAMIFPPPDTADVRALARYRLPRVSSRLTSHF